MDAVTTLLEVALDLDAYLAVLATRIGAWLYVVVFGVVFCETGLVVAPFLPGDSLLFAGGTLAGAGILDPVLLGALVFAAAVLGDAVNYSIGRVAGRRVTSGRLARMVPARHVERTERFYRRHGGKTIVLARFMPLVRTFAPFVAGASRMDVRRFAFFNVTGAALWTTVFVGAGFFFGEVPWVRDHLSVVVAVTVVLSLLPACAGALFARLRRAPVNRLLSDGPPSSGESTRPERPPCSAGGGRMKCPSCHDTDLYRAQMLGVQLDRCPGCAGAWLEQGRLDEILARATSHDASRSQDHGDRSDRGVHGHDEPKGKKRSLFGDLIGGFGGD